MVHDFQSEFEVSSGLDRTAGELHQRVHLQLLVGEIPTVRLAWRYEEVVAGVVVAIAKADLLWKAQIPLVHYLHTGGA